MANSEARDQSRSAGPVRGRLGDGIQSAISRLLAVLSTETVDRDRRVQSDGGRPADAPDGPASLPPDAFMDKDERVRQLLEEHGGRIRQPEVVKATSWSKATVSRLLSEMEENGEIERFRVGREKVVCLPDKVPETVVQAAG